MGHRRLLASVALLALALAAPASARQGPPPQVQLVSGPSPLTAERCAGAQPTEAESFPWLAVRPDAPHERTVVWLQDGEAGVLAASSTDGGVSWRTSVPTPLLTCRPDDADHVSEPRVAVTPSGAIYATAFSRDATTVVGRTLVARSVDGGATWSPTTRPDTGVDPLADFDALAVAPDRPDAVYVLWSQPEVVGEPPLLSRSTDGGRTWTRTPVRLAVPGTASWSRLSVLPGGRLVVVYQDAPVAALFSPVSIEGPVWAISSGDDGATWSVPTLLGQGTPLQWPSVAAGSSGEVYASWVRAGEGDCRRLLPLGGEVGVGCEAVVVRSGDGGATWSAPVPVLAWTGAWVPTPGVAVAGDGTVGLLAVVPAPEDSLAPVLARSTDCGRTWQSARLADPTAAGAAEPGEADGAGLALQLAGLPDGFAAAVPRGAPAATVGATDVFALDVRTKRSGAGGPCGGPRGL
jgi:hypothetical protein